MLHFRTSKAKIEALCAALNGWGSTASKWDADGFRKTVVGNTVHEARCAELVARLQSCFAAKCFDLSEDEARDVVLALDGANYWGTNNIDRFWSAERAALSNEMKAQFLKAYGVPVYRNGGHPGESIPGLISNAGE